MIQFLDPPIRFVASRCERLLDARFDFAREDSVLFVDTRLGAQQLAALHQTTLSKLTNSGAGTSIAAKPSYDH